MTNELREDGASAKQEKLSIIGKLILVLCVIGVVVVVYLALDSSGLTLFDEHAAQVIADAWNTDATIGLIVALATATFIGIFVYIMAKATVANPADEVIETETTVQE
jgi:heme/copper-type cytochrome/quinol oxidase subunit 2